MAAVLRVAICEQAQLKLAVSGVVFFPKHLSVCQTEAGKLTGAQTRVKMLQRCKQWPPHFPFLKENNLKKAVSSGATKLANHHQAGIRWLYWPPL